ncbi:PTS system N,N'-diacetylchitobiose-specific EIIA component [Vibrio stylophorae]|uniref:PTS system N,N'-diacetylchitobiose-specific EIIA component n=1 Tax=Vibrio stylophorae TaxID=659351 RepID=A0ABN8DY62_9VIBR|nr:PTS lactose/cellobiose transporter subunit IIA [Vibrio stylophorae]CAH0534312.1 PTS system N,N'-diacetylchitobiose-specific EIIA component [Vibrio stylophorae]
MVQAIQSSDDITEEFLMTLLCQVGEARAAFMEAMSAARQGHFDEASRCLNEGDQALIDVHRSQTSLIGFDEGEGKVTMTLILTHIQDHIMTTMLCRDLAAEIVGIHQLIREKEFA